MLLLLLSQRGGVTEKFSKQPKSIVRKERK
jgi:hypothetical protein